MRPIFIVVLLLINFGTAFAQNNYRDLLKERLKLQNSKKSYLYQLIKSEKKHDHIAIIYNQLGLIYQHESNLDSAAVCHENALKNAWKVSKNNQEIGVSYNKIGIIFYYRGELDSALIYLKKSVPYFKDKKLKANALNNLALMNKYNSNPDIAIKNYLSAVSIYKEFKDTLNQIYVYNNVAALYTDLENYEKCKFYLKTGLRLAGNKEKYKGPKYSCQGNLAGIYNKEEKFDKAIKLLRDNIVYYESTKQYSFLIANKINLANSYDGMGEKQNALSLYIETLRLMETVQLELNKEALFINIASCYEDLNNHSEALKFYRRALHLAKANELVLRYESIYKGLSSVHQKLKNSDSSIFYKDLQITLRDSLDNVEKETKMMELESKHRNKELGSNLKSSQDQLSNTEAERSWFATGLAYALLIILITVFIIFFIFLRYKKKKELNKQLIDRNEKNQDNITTLKTSLGNKDEEIERLNQQKGIDKLDYPSELVPLTEREKEVLEGVKEGLKDQEIADKLFISITTVRTHLRKAYVKIDARNRAEAIQFISNHHI